MDMMRGSLILLVIIQHWISDFYLHDAILNSSFYRIIYEIKIVFAPYRMELLFFLSGFIVHKSLNKDFKKYLSGKINNLLYPYMLWSFIFLLLYNYPYILSGNYHPVTNYIIRIFMGATNLTWFLYFLFAYFLVALKILKSEINPYVVIACAAVLCYIASGYNFYSEIDVNYLEEGDIFYYFIYFYLGCHLGIKKYNLVAISKNYLFLLVAIISLIAVETLNFHTSLQKTDLIYFPFVILSIPLAIFTSVQIQKITIIRKMLTHISLNSITYYLMHLVLLKVYSKIFEMLDANQVIAFPLKLLITFITIYIFILLKKRFDIFSILFQPFYKKKIQDVQ